ncbi:MAG: hypothetical protein QOF77_2380 [Solirubrobacteraceae bacterium]|jgi:uncharacterized membrane protein YkoI|nr:hypothetical protein [Solirubrobacteraceae bacterium]
MGKHAKRSGIALVVLSAAAVGSVGLADAASAVKQHKRAGHAAAATSPAAAETLLTGATLQSVSAAALAAVPGATVERASVENPSDASGAAYEVHLTKTDASRAEVLEDASFKVLSVSAGPGHGPRGPGGPAGNPNETVLTGATLASARSAALAAVPGGSVTRASAEDKHDKSGADYEIHVTKTDGSEVEVLEDGAFKVLSVTAGHPRGGPGLPGGPGGPHGHGGPEGPGH